MLHLITPLYRYNNVETIYSSIIHQVKNFQWHLIEGSEKASSTTDISKILSDDRVFYYKIKTSYQWGHEQRNYFIKKIPSEESDWCFFLDDDTVLTGDLVNSLLSPNSKNFDVIVFAQKKGMTEQVRLYGNSLELGTADIGSFLVKAKILKRLLIEPTQRNSDGHLAAALKSMSNIKIQYNTNKFTRYNALSLSIN
jgi:hypothetical protein